MIATLRVSSVRDRHSSSGPRVALPPKYDLAKVSRALLEEAVRLHPKCLPAGELCRRIVGNPDDKREMETASRAIHHLREFGLLSGCEDDTTKLTNSALKAGELLID